MSMLIQEITKKETKVKIIEQEDILIMLEHGKILTAALITEENLITLKEKLQQVVREVEDFYEEELDSFKGNVAVFSKVGKFIQKIFES